MLTIAISEKNEINDERTTTINKKTQRSDHNKK